MFWGAVLDCLKPPWTKNVKRFSKRSSQILCYCVFIRLHEKFVQQYDTLSNTQPSTTSSGFRNNRETLGFCSSDFESDASLKTFTLLTISFNLNQNVPIFSLPFSHQIDASRTLIKPIHVNPKDKQFCLKNFPPIISNYCSLQKENNMIFQSLMIIIWNKLFPGTPKNQLVANVAEFPSYSLSTPSPSCWAAIDL